MTGIPETVESISNSVEGIESRYHGQLRTTDDTTAKRGVVINLFTASDRFMSILANHLKQHFLYGGYSPISIVRSETPIAEVDAAVWPTMALDVARRRQQVIEKVLKDGTRMVIVEEPPVMLAMAASMQNWKHHDSERALAALHKMLPTINLLVRTGHPHDKPVEDMIENGLLRNGIGFDQVAPGAYGVAISAQKCVDRILAAGLRQTNPYAAAADAGPTPTP